MKPFHRKILFFELMLLYVMIVLAVREHIVENPDTIATSVLWWDRGGGGVIDPYKNLAKKVALTFDDGPDPYYTELLLDGLKERTVQATFFVTGRHAEQNPEIIARMYAEGHLVGNHTYSHIQLKNTNREKYKAELLRTSQILQKITGEMVQFVRPTYRTWDKKLEEELDMLPVMWTVDPRDWCQSSAECIAQNVIKRVKEGDIILLHDQYDPSVKAAFMIVDELKRQGYEFVTVDEMMLD